MLRSCFRALCTALVCTPLLFAAENDAITPAAGLPAEMPWKLTELSKPPEFEWIDQTGGVRALTYTGEPYKEKKQTKVFAYFASPATLVGVAEPKKAAYPGIVLVHGGGGTAFKEWAELWAKRGYAAIAMDLAGKSVGDAGGPDQGDDTKFADPKTALTDYWTYHAVANVIRAHSLLRSFPEVDRERTAVTGISWGGYLTCLVAPLDSRFKAAVPVYGCGFLHENSVWLPRFEKMRSEERDRWVAQFDPSRYLPACRVPILFVNGTNDFAYPLDSYRKSYNAVPGEKNIRITVNMPHGHPQGWAPAEIGAFIDSKLNGGKPLVKLRPPTTDGGNATAAVTAGTRVKTAELHYASDAGPINKRTWKTEEAKVGENVITAPLPVDATVWFFTATDERGLVVSSEVVFGEAEKAK